MQLKKLKKKQTMKVSNMETAFDKWMKDIDNCPVFEKIYNTYIRDTFSDCTNNILYRLFHFVRMESFRAGQKSERDKHRWIPITERNPTKDDGHFCKCNDGTEYVEVIVKDIHNDVYADGYCLNKQSWVPNNLYIDWQPLPEV